MSTFKDYITIHLLLISIVVFGSSNTLNDLSNRECILNKRDDLHVHVFNMITEINELKTLSEHMSCKCECKFDDRKYKSNQTWNNEKCRCKR